MRFTGSKMDVVRFVADIVVLSKNVSASITITTLGSSEDCSVSIATDMLSADTVEKVAQNYFARHTNTSLLITQVGQFHLKSNEERKGNDVRKNETFLIGFVSGFFTAMALFLLVGGLDAAGKLDPLLDFLGVK